mgnify:CR=1 FL=1
MSCDIDSDSFHGTKKGGRRKTVSSRRAYEKSKQLRQKRNIDQTHPERYTLAMIADLESRINSTMAVMGSNRIGTSRARKWLNVLKDMYVFYEAGYR